MNRRIPTIAGALALFLSLFLAAPLAAQDGVAAQPSADLSDEQVDRFMGWMGLIDAIPVIVRAQIDKHPEQTGITDAQRDCALERIVPTMRAALRVNFRELLGDRETYLGWEAFSATEGGKRMFAQVRASLHAKLDGTSAPAKTEGFEGMSDEEMQETMTFMLSPAAKILSKKFPEIDPPKEALERVAGEVKTACGLELPL